MGAAVEVVEVRKTYRSSPETALFGVSFSLAPGTFAALLGPSGCGKSTLRQLPTRGPATAAPR